MAYLVVGILIFCCTHLMLSATPGLHNSLVLKFGENGFKAAFTLVSITSIVLMVMGWKSTTPDLVYLQPAWGRPATSLLLLLTFIAMFAPYSQNSVRRLTRHPQLLGVLAWGVGHLLSNGELRSLLLFGGLAIWALLEIVMINRREGTWEKPDEGTPKGNLQLFLTGLGFFAIFMYSHGWLFGVSVAPA